jgi:hypothetical protein
VTLFVANQDFSVQVAGADVEVKRGDFWDDSTALYIQCAAASPPLFFPLPDGITVHHLTVDWES